MDGFAPFWTDLDSALDKLKGQGERGVECWREKDLHMASRQCAILPGVRERQDRGRIESAGNSLFTYEPLILVQEPLR